MECCTNYLVSYLAIFKSTKHAHTSPIHQLVRSYRYRQTTCHAVTPLTGMILKLRCQPDTRVLFPPSAINRVLPHAQRANPVTSPS